MLVARKGARQQDGDAVTEVTRQQAVVQAGTTLLHFSRFLDVALLAGVQYGPGYLRDRTCGKVRHGSLVIRCAAGSQGTA